MNFFEGKAPPTVRAALKPRIRLFLSADIVGSTAFKQRRTASEQWFRVVMRFYRDAEMHFLSRWRARAGAEHEDATRLHLFGTELPELWKTIGDEVVFTQLVDRPWQVATCIDVWTDTLKLIKAELAKEDAALDLKSTAWLADFPLRNREVGLRTVGSLLDDPEDLSVTNHQRLAAYYAKEPGYARDFVGPSIDTGFRLGGFASPRRMGISLELAHVLSGVHSEMEGNRPASTVGIQYVAPHFFYDGAEPLRGVLGGVPYPRFWIDVGGEQLHRAEDRLLRRLPAELDSVHRFTTAFILQHPDQFCAGLNWWIPHIPTAYESYCDQLLDQVLAEERRLCEAEVSEQIKIEAGEMPDSESTALVPELDHPAWGRSEG